MRAVIIAVLLAAPVPAFSQTATDIARQQWPLATPVTNGAAPAAQSVFGGFDHDVSREVWLRNAPLAAGVAPTVPTASGAFMSADVARLRDGTATTVAPRIEAPYLTAVSH